jgi:hypothetical protein
MTTLPINLHTGHKHQKSQPADPARTSGEQYLALDT